MLTNYLTIISKEAIAFRQANAIPTNSLHLSGLYTGPGTSASLPPHDSSQGKPDILYELH